jgi:hypothetical protein
MIGSSPAEFYKERIRTLTTQQQARKRQYNRIAMLRLLIILAGAIGIYIMEEWMGICGRHSHHCIGCVLKTGIGVGKTATAIG